MRGTLQTPADHRLAFGNKEAFKVDLDSNYAKTTTPEAAS